MTRPEPTATEHHDRLLSPFREGAALGLALGNITGALLLDVAAIITNEPLFALLGAVALIVGFLVWDQQGCRFAVVHRHPVCEHFSGWGEDVDVDCCLCMRNRCGDPGLWQRLRHRDWRITRDLYFARMEKAGVDVAPF